MSRRHAKPRRLAGKVVMMMMSGLTAMRKSQKLVVSTQTPKHSTTALITLRRLQALARPGAVATDGRGAADIPAQQSSIQDVAKILTNLRDQLDIIRLVRRVHARVTSLVHSPDRLQTGTYKPRTPKRTITLSLLFPEVRRRLVVGSEEIVEMIWTIDCQRRNAEHLHMLLIAAGKESASVEVL